MLDTNKHICNISMHIVTKGLPKQSPLHRDDDTAFKNATAHTNTCERTRTHKQTNNPPPKKKKEKKHSLQNMLPPVAENPYDVAAAQGPQKQMDAKNKATARLATRGNSWIFHDASFTKSWYLQGFVKS